MASIFVAAGVLSAMCVLASYRMMDKGNLI
jgi:hypothetical protein